MEEGDGVLWKIIMHRKGEEAIGYMYVDFFFQPRNFGWHQIKCSVRIGEFGTFGRAFERAMDLLAPRDVNISAKLTGEELLKNARNRENYGSETNITVFFVNFVSFASNRKFYCAIIDFLGTFPLRKRKHSNKS